MATAVQMDKVFTGGSSNSQSTTYNWVGGVGQFMAKGTWDTATLKMQMSPDEGTTWIDIGTSVTFTSDGIGNFELGPSDIRADLSSVGASTSLDCWMTVRHGKAL